MEQIPAGRGTLAAGGGGAGFDTGVGTDGFFSSGGETLGIQDAKITTKKKT